MTRPLDVLVLRGAPGAGKSTLGRHLRKALPSGAVIEVDDLRGMLAQVDWSSREHHDIAMSVAMEALLGFLGVGVRPVVLIDTFSRSRLHAVQARLDRSGLRHHTLSLWVQPDVLKARLEARTTGFKDWEPSNILNDEVASNRYPFERLVDATPLTPEAVTALALELVAAQGEVST